MSVFANSSTNAPSNNPGPVVSDDLAVITAMNTFSKMLREVPEGRRLMQLALVRLGEQRVIAELTANALSVSPRLAALAIEAELWTMLQVFDMMSQHQLSAAAHEELGRKADVIFADLAIDLRAIRFAANEQLVGIIMRSLGTERPLSFLDRLLY